MIKWDLCTPSKCVLAGEEQAQRLVLAMKTQYSQVTSLSNEGSTSQANLFSRQAVKRSHQEKYKKFSYLHCAIWELVGQNVAINLSRGGHPGQYPTRMCYPKWTKIFGRVNFCK